MDDAWAMSEIDGLRELIQRDPLGWKDIDPGPGAFWCIMGPDGRADEEAEDGPVGLFRADGSCVLFMAREAYEGLRAKLREGAPSSQR